MTCQVPLTFTIEDPQGRRTQLEVLTGRGPCDNAKEANNSYKPGDLPTGRAACGMGFVATPELGHEAVSLGTQAETPTVGTRLGEYCAVGSGTASLRATDGTVQWSATIAVP